MARSRSGHITLQSLIDEGYDPLDYRYYLLGAHYRSQLSFSFDALKAARNARSRLVERIGRLEKRSETDWSENARGGSRGQEYLRAFEESVTNDLNMPKALADVWNLVRDGEISPSKKLDVLDRMDCILGLSLRGAGDELPELEEETRQLLAERETARAARDFGRADEIRKVLAQKGIMLEDTEGGVRWRRKRSTDSGHHVFR